MEPFDFQFLLLDCEVAQRLLPFELLPSDESTLKVGDLERERDLVVRQHSNVAAIEHCFSFLLFLGCLSCVKSNLFALFVLSLLDLCKFKGEVDQDAYGVFTSREPDDQLSLTLV